MKNRVHKSLVAIASLTTLSSVSALAVPKNDTSSLPVTDNMITDASLADVMAYIPKLTVYQDANDPLQYYYVAPMRAVQGVAATAIVNQAQVQRADEVARLRRDLQGIAGRDYFFLQAQYNGVIARLANLKPEEASFKPTLEEIATRLKAEYEQATLVAADYEKVVPDGLRRVRQEGIAEALGAAGMNVTNPADVRERATLEGRLNRSNGGVFTANVFAGFYGNEVAFMKRYHEARAKRGLPQVRISLLPLTTFTWGSLTETAVKADGTETEGIPLFRQVQGGGNFTGATVNLDLTLDGARKFATNVGPVIVPVYGKAKLVMKYPAFRAQLKCDFTTGWSVEGRTDVRDGLVIYNNDVTTNMVATDISTTNKPCSVQVEGGGGDATREAAIRSAVDKVKERLTDLFFTRTALAKNEKDAYFQGVMADIQNNRHSGANRSNGGWFSVATSYLTGGWSGVFVSAFSQAGNFYWHTNKQNVKVLSQVKWEEEIVENGNTQIPFDVPTNICVVYNPAQAGYVACSEQETAQATTITNASNAALASPTCAGTSDAVGCGEARAGAAPTNPSTGSLLPVEL